MEEKMVGRKGDWRKLTQHLKNLRYNKGQTARLSDNNMKKITGSVDKRPILPIVDHRLYNIKKRAADADFDVQFALNNRGEKIFTKIT